MKNFLRLRPGSLTLSGVFVATSLTAWGHPGHSWAESSASHLLASPDHAAILGLLGVAMGVGSHFIRQHIPRVVVRCCAVAGLAGAVLLW